MTPRLAIIVPVLDEADRIGPWLAALEPLRRRGAQLVVVDGGSADGTLDIARAHADIAFRAPRGRAAQMNAGAAACRADVLLFLQLPAGDRNLRLVAGDRLLGDLELVCRTVEPLRSRRRTRVQLVELLAGLDELDLQLAHGGLVCARTLGADQNRARECEDEGDGG